MSWSIYCILLQIEQHDKRLTWHEMTEINLKRSDKVGSWWITIVSALGCSHLCCLCAAACWQRHSDVCSGHQPRQPPAADQWPRDSDDDTRRCLEGCSRKRGREPKLLWNKHLDVYLRMDDAALSPISQTWYNLLFVFTGNYRLKWKNLIGTACESQTSTNTRTICWSSWKNCSSIIG